MFNKKNRDIILTDTSPSLEFQTIMSYVNDTIKYIDVISDKIDIIDFI